MKTPEGLCWQHVSGVTAFKGNSTGPILAAPASRTDQTRLTRPPLGIDVDEPQRPAHPDP
ncbi:MAG: hypothetical protein ACFN4T_02385 [Peptidiphaga sp.]